MTNLDTVSEYERSLSLAKILDSAITVRELQKAVGFRQVAVALDIQLTRLVADLNLKWNMDDRQIKSIIEDLLSQYENESIEDFILCFRKAKRGEYGELTRLDTAIIFSWMRKYLDEKYQLFEARIASNQVQTNSDNMINYEAYRARIEQAPKPKNNAVDNAYARQRLANPYKYYNVRGLQIMATSQEHAERTVKLMIERGDVEEVPQDE